MESLAENNIVCNTEELARLHDQFLGDIDGLRHRNREPHVELQNGLVPSARPAASGPSKTTSTMREIDDSQSRSSRANQQHAMNSNFNAELQDRLAGSHMHEIPHESPFPHSYPGGDTQPMDTQVYREFAQSMLKSDPVVMHHEYGLNGQVEVELPNGDTQQSNIMEFDGSLKTCQEGDVGYINLQAWVPQSPAMSSEAESGYEELLQDQSDLPALGSKLIPATPANNNRGLNSQTRILTSDARTVTTAKITPGTSQWLGSKAKGKFLSATQMFNQTQAPSSPVPHMLRSDPVVTRPSPNFDAEIKTSPLFTTASSPLPPQSATRDSGSEGARDKYTSLRESQEMRSRLAEQAVLGAAQGQFVSGLDYEMDIDATREEFERRRLRRAMSARNLSECAKIKGIPKSIAGAVRGQKTHVVDLVTPIPTRKTGRISFAIPDANLSEAEAILNEADELAGRKDINVNEMINGEQKWVPVDGDSDDEYDELAQTVIRSQPIDPETDDEPDDEEPRDLHSDDRTVLLPHQAERERMCSTNVLTNLQTAVPNSDVVELMHMTSNTQKSGVMGTQGGDGPEHSSICSFVPGSQYTGKTSQERAQAQAKLWKGHDTARITSYPNGLVEHLPSSPPPVGVLQGVSSPMSSPQSVSTHMKSPLLDSSSNGHTMQEIPDSSTRDGGHVNILPQVSGMTFSTARTHMSTVQSNSKSLLEFRSPPSSSQNGRTVSFSPRKAAGVRSFADIAFQPSQASGETQHDIDAVVNGIFTEEDQQYRDVISSPVREQPPRKRQRRIIMDDTSSIAAALTPVTVVEVEGREAAALAGTPTPVEPTGKPDASVPRHDSCGQPYEHGKNSRHDCVGHQTEGFVSVSAPSMSMTKINERSLTSKTAPSAVTGVPKTYSRKRQKKQKPAIVTTGEIEKQPSSGIAGDVYADPVTGTGQNTAASAETAMSPLEVVCPTRVLALFRGQYNRHYPATWICLNVNNKTHRVRYDDGSEWDVESQHICRLEFRPGDVVRVDQQAFKGKNWTVKGFGPIVEDNLRPKLGTDQYGRAQIVLQVKRARASTMVDAGADDDETITVAVTDVSIPRTSWPLYSDRVFEMPVAKHEISSRAETPHGGPTLDDWTPGSRTKRSSMSELKVSCSVETRAPNTFLGRADSVKRQGIFDNMAFALSYGSVEQGKISITRQILSHGGVILEDGFDELFDLQGSELSVKHDSNGDDGEDHASLQIKHEYRQLGFVVLIADKHSRRAKYVQALALGLPTLSGRWILDSLDCKKNASLLTAHATPLPWNNYLLPAGESAYLSGAVRSRTLLPYDAERAVLLDTLHNRERLLHNDGVIIVAGKKIKSYWEKRKPYIFLTLALGASHVRRVADLDEAKALLADGKQKWNWVYVDGSTQDAKQILLDDGQIKAGVKRKWSSDADRRDSFAMSAAEQREVRVVDDEFVIQSVILGALFE